MSVLIETTVGDLVFDLHTEERPRSTLNFLKLCKIKYYNYCLFHSVRRNFIAQCGDPTGTGRGGESIYSFLYGDQAKYFDLEPKPRIKHKTKGTISFVNNGNDKHGSQFFITLGEGLDFLDGKHTIFGVLSEGFETLERINETICDEKHKPYRDVRITHTIILYDPYDDPKGLTIPDRSPEPTQEQLESGRIGADEDIDDGGKTKEEVQKEIEEKELQIGTKILETVGDINEADEKPPENVLFVCKLNPITKAEDLKIIFSRFGKIKSCEIIKDFKTGDSLCYGFVEFKEVESCEKAYFKMDNVLIDDRRIHVDFCQSVGKIKKNFKQLSRKGDQGERSGERVYDMKEDRSKKKEEKFSMLFEEETTGVQAKKRKEKKSNEVLKEKEEKTKKRKDSDSEDERPVPKKSEEKKSKAVAAKEAPSKRRKSPSPSQSEDDTNQNRKPTSKKKTTITREKPAKKVTRRDRSDSSSSSSDEDDGERSKKKLKKKSGHKNVKVEELDKKSHKKEKKRRPPDESESEVEVKRKVKRRKSESESDSEEDEKERLKKIKKLKKKKKDDSEDDHKQARRSKEDRKKTKKTKPVHKTKSKSADESDSDDDDKKVKSKSRQKKRSDPSSDESSSEEDRKKQLRTKSKPRRHENSSDDDQKKKKLKKLSHKKKVRKRRASSESDSSD